MKLINYHLKEIETALATLKADKQAFWGKMTASQMLQHLIDIAQISNGTIEVEFANNKVPIEKLRHILFKEVPFPKEFAAPEQVEGMIARNKVAESENIELLKGQLIIELEKMESFLSDGKKVTNAVFGPLDLEDWKWFHRKHISHHFAQFGIWAY